MATKNLIIIIGFITMAVISQIKETINGMATCTMLLWLSVFKFKINPVFEMYWLQLLCNHKSAGPGPLKIIAAQPTGNVYALAAEVHARHLF